MRKVKTTGAQRMTELGKKPVQLWFSPSDHAAILNASIRDGRPMTQFIQRCVLACLGKKFYGASRYLNPQAAEDA
jgi:hypothetical protein